jgi:hypothetical protein
MTEKRMTTREVLDAVARERARLRTAVEALRDGASTVRVTAEGWTAKDVLAHCIHWAGQIAFGMGATLERPAYLARYSDHPSGEEWNRRVVEHYRSAPLEDVQRELDRRVDALLERARLRTDDDMNAQDAIPWAPGRPLWQQIAAETFEHWPAHAADIERAAQAVT